MLPAYHVIFVVVPEMFHNVGASKLKKKKVPVLSKFSKSEACT
jgi:hypothetical protein